MGHDTRTEFWITILGLLRRRQVIIRAVLLALTMGALAYLVTPVMYVSSSTMVLTTTEYGGTESQDPSNPIELTNPMMNFNESLRTTSAILIQAMNTEDVAEQLGASGPTTFVVDDGRTNPTLLGLNGPFLYVVAKSTSPDEAARVVLDAQKLMRAKLRDWQSALNAPQNTYVSVVDVVPPTAPEPNRSQATKLGVMAFVLGFLLSIGIAYFGHQVRARRRARRPSAPLARAPEDDEEGAEPVVVAAPVNTTEPAGVPEHVPKVRPARVPAPKKKSQRTVVRTSSNKTAETPAAPVDTAGSAGVPEHMPKMGPSGVPAPKKKSQRTVVRTTSNKRAETPALAESPEGDQLVVVPVPVKANVRSRNR